jgi:uncharacterized membrane protein
MKSKGPEQYRHPKSVEELTEQNISAVIEMERAAKSQRSLADRVADFISGFCGTMAYVTVHAIWFTVWILWNTVFTSHPFDPFPFPFLTLVVSLEAIFLTTFILISGNRKARVDERRNHLDLQIDLLSEQENTKMLTLLKRIANKLGVDAKGDPSLAVLEQATEPDKLIEQIDRSVDEADLPEAAKK